MIDTSRTIEIERSPAKLALFLIFVLGMTAFSLAVASIPVPEFEVVILVKTFGYSGAAFFGLCAVIAIWNLIKIRVPVVTISPQGIRDTRLAAEMIPWSAVKGISTWTADRSDRKMMIITVLIQRMMVLAVDPAVEKALTFTTIARWSRSVFGANRLGVSATSLKIDNDTLLATSLAYARAHGGAA